MRYRYAGPQPVPDPSGEVVHPGDTREFSTAPDCPPWEPLEAPEPVPPVPAKEPAPAASLTARTPKGK